MTSAQITIIRSQRRKKTIQTKYGDGHLWIYLPAGMSSREEQQWIERMIERNSQWEKRKSRTKSDSWLMQRAQELNDKYFDGTLDFSIKYVTNQKSRFGSCTSMDRTIRISEQVRSMPTWVQDYVIIHELTHLMFPDHSKEFWAKVNSYPYSERAKGYLIALDSGTVDLEPQTQ